MSAVKRTSSVLRILYAPESVLASLQQEPTVGLPLIVIGAVAAVLLFLQSTFVQTALGESLTLQAGEGTPAASPSWLFWLRLAMVLVAPLGIFLRAFAFGTLLYVLQDAAGGEAPWKSCVALAVLAEAVYLVESVCTLALLAWTRPRSMEALRLLELRAGMNLFWQPASLHLHQFITTVNLFVVWWGWLLWEGCRRLARLNRRRAAIAVLPLWTMAVLLRLLLQNR